MKALMAEAEMEGRVLTVGTGDLKVRAGGANMLCCPVAYTGSSGNGTDW